MKKIVCAIVIMLTGITLVACGSKSEIKESLNSNIIEIRNNLYAGADDSFYATFCSGEREEPYGLDGKINNKVDFGIVTISKKDNTKLTDEEYLFTIVINGESHSGTLTKSPYDNTYSADIGIQVDNNAEIKLSTDLDGVVFDQVLYNESKDFTVSQSNAIDMACEELEDVLKALKKSDLKYEAMVKILKDYSGETNRYFWYVGLVAEDGTTAGILIDCNSGEIISKKV
ncbi:MAG: hypothetical protein IJX26_03115 [Clostridia bacterium]|nr:hypothetical protein [Clostridia bacterium]